MPDINDMFQRALSMGGNGDFEDAIRVLTELIAYTPFPPAFRMRARCYTDMIRSGKYPEEKIRLWLNQAKHDLTTTIQMYQDLPPETYRQLKGDEYISDCFCDRGEITMLLATTYKGFSTALQNTDMDDEDSFKNLVNMLYSEDNNLLREAVGDANQAIKLNKNNISAYRLKAFIYDTYFDDQETAVEQYTKVISINASPLDYYNRAWCNYLVGNKKEARSDCKRAINLDANIKGVTPVSANRGKRDKWESFWRDCVQG